MKKRFVVSGACLAAALAFVLGRAVAEEDPMAEMAEWIKLGTPGKEHADLAKLAGKWNATSKWWMAEGVPAQESTGTAEYAPIFDGRYVEQAYHGDAAPMGPFEGKSILGYDNASKQYFATWIDSMSTGIMLLRGTADASGKVLTMTGEMTGPGGKIVKMRTVSTFVDENTHKFEMFESKDGGPERKSGEMVYTRAK